MVILRPGEMYARCRACVRDSRREGTCVTSVMGDCDEFLLPWVATGSRGRRQRRTLASFHRVPNSPCLPHTFPLLPLPSARGMGVQFGSFDTICQTAALVICPLLGSDQGIEPTCYSRNVDIAGTLIFQPCEFFPPISEWRQARIHAN